MTRPQMIAALRLKNLMKALIYEAAISHGPRLPLTRSFVNPRSIPTAPITGNPPHTDKAGFRKSYCEQKRWVGRVARPQMVAALRLKDLMKALIL